VFIITLLRRKELNRAVGKLCKGCLKGVMEKEGGKNKGSREWERTGGSKDERKRETKREKWGRGDLQILLLSKDVMTSKVSHM
jgi:hypothetical protein